MPKKTRDDIPATAKMVAALILHMERVFLQVFPASERWFLFFPLLFHSARSRNRTTRAVPTGRQREEGGGEGRSGHKSLCTTNGQTRFYQW